ncbi:hypothetical protein BOTBODRAFT_38414 [Botryobasidium botryosum FD-172 SS1]|uniref:Protein kinase domain-containing protein n=1 Tax=Botryobasidium botryosum (strain FD-172 SS1) TaxID=930990 RepID=A0A067M7P6_BOTB1|nr:hypothetical protein BOTBODRAFT_38414 [Botryobasidium botryosum FD-172 SS1]
MNGQTSMSTIITLVAQTGVYIDALQEKGAEIRHRDLTDLEKEVCKGAMHKLREEMLAQPPLARDIFTMQLSQLYSALNYYPSDPALHECEVTVTKIRASNFGGFADCWEGLFLGRHKVAMKAPRGRFAEEIKSRRLAREARVWSRLSHPNVLPFLGLCTLASISYLVSPWMENGHALEFVQRHPDANCLRLLLQVANGLEYLHGFEPAVIHGDLRGPNILISELGEAHIADFGLSEFKVEESSPKYSTPWLVAGHPRWQAPEIINAKPKEARRNMKTDVFAFGRVMLELLTQAVPFSSIPLDFKVMLEVMKGSFPSRPCDAGVVARGLNDEMWRVMTDCWDADPARRPCASDLVVRLSIASGTQSDRETSSRPKKRLRVSGGVA